MPGEEQGGPVAEDLAQPAASVRARIAVNAIAAQGVVVAMVDFRNALMPSASQPLAGPYPAGLDDCMAGLEWCVEHARTDLNVDPARILLAGESGGGSAPWWRSWSTGWWTP